MRRKLFCVFMSVLFMTSSVVAYGQNSESRQNNDVNHKEEVQEEMFVDIGDGIVINVLALAEANDVDPYELKESIENGLGSERSSPFSDLATKTPNTEAAESVETVMTKSGRAETKVSKTNQDSTAYVAKSGAVTANGKTPKIGMCAMHIDVTTKTGSTTSSKVKLGTTIYLDSEISVNGTDRTTLDVEDRGAPTNRTTYWIDLYFGLNNTTNYNAAVDYGVQKVSYSWYY